MVLLDWERATTSRICDSGALPFGLFNGNLSQKFCNPEQVNSIEEIEILFSKGLQEIREYERQLKTRTINFLIGIIELLKKRF